MTQGFEVTVWIFSEDGWVGFYGLTGSKLVLGLHAEFVLLAWLKIFYHVIVLTAGYRARNLLPEVCPIFTFLNHVACTKITFRQRRNGRRKTEALAPGVRPMAHDPSSPPKNWYQNLVPETWVQVLHTRHTRNWYHFLGGELGSSPIVCHGPKPREGR